MTALPLARRPLFPARVLRASAAFALMLAPVLGSDSAAASPAAGPASWVWPVSGAPQVLRAFDPGAGRYGAGHRGVDLAAPAGTLVRAVGDGRVSYAGPLAGRGVVVVVHGALRTTYEPVQARVRMGQLIAAGDPLGVLSGAHLGCPRSCLHWGLLRGEDYLDPLLLVRRARSVLLPLGGTSWQLHVPPPGAPRRAAGPSHLEVPRATPAPPAAVPAAWTTKIAEHGRATGASAALALLGLTALARRRRRA